MTFSYNPFATDKDRVRFHIADTVVDEAWLSDEEINAIIVEAGNSWQAAVIMALEYILFKLSGPNVQADWLTISTETARAGYEKMLLLKRRELKQPAFTAGITHRWRKDSNQTEAPTYEDQNLIIYKI